MTAAPLAPFRVEAERYINALQTGTYAEAILLLAGLLEQAFNAGARSERQTEERLSKRRHGQRP